MKTRTFPKAKITATELALGTWAIGGNHYGPVSDKQAHDTVIAYLEAGGNFIDTARSYHQAEDRIGQTLSEMGNRSDIIIASKTKNGGTLESIPQIREELEQSLKALRTDYIDIYQLHSPSDDPEVVAASIAELEKLKAEGKIRATGASIKGANVDQEVVDLCKTYIDAGIEVIQLIYSIARQETSGVFEYAQANGVGIIARTVLESGFLTGKYDRDTKFSTIDHRIRWSPEQVQGVADIANDIKMNHLTAGYQSPSDIAIKFALAEPAITTLILGAKTPEQACRNTAVDELPVLPIKTVQHLKSKYSEGCPRFNPTLPY
ncbi:MAG: aldo/keto reductase [Opitutaceae bacterium]